MDRSFNHVQHRATREFDVCVFGATGFTGKLISEYLLSAASQTDPAAPALRVALAGRNLEKLEELKQSLPSSQPPSILLANVQTDSAAVLEALVRRIRVVICAVGPFLELAEPLVAACAAVGTHWVDITGETPFVRLCIDSYATLARENGSFIINMCGFDSVPSDLGTYRTVQRISQAFKQPTRRVQTFVTMRGELSGGTLESSMVMERNPHFRAQMNDPFLLGGIIHGGVRPEDEDIGTVLPMKACPFESDGIVAWTAPFMMAKLNTRTVRRSNALIGYGERFNYSEKMIVSDAADAAKLAKASPPVTKREAMRNEGRLPRQGEGPSAAQRAKGWFKFIFVGEAEDGRKLVTSVAGGDPGYNETAKMAAECALALIYNFDNCNAVLQGVHGGCVTPAFAFGDALINRLTAVNIKFIDEDPTFDEVAKFAGKPNHTTASETLLRAAGIPKKSTPDLFVEERRKLRVQSKL